MDVKEFEGFTPEQVSKVKDLFGSDIMIDIYGVGHRCPTIHIDFGSDYIYYLEKYKNLYIVHDFHKNKSYDPPYLYRGKNFKIALERLIKEEERIKKMTFVGKLTLNILRKKMEDSKINYYVRSFFQTGGSIIIPGTSIFIEIHDNHIRYFKDFMNTDHSLIVECTEPGAVDRVLRRISKEYHRQNKV